MRYNQGAYVPIQQVRDVQPIRSTCFHPTGQVYVIGSNSKALKICKYPDETERAKLIHHSRLNGNNDNNQTNLSSQVSFDNTDNHDDFSCGSDEDDFDDKQQQLREPDLAFTCLHVHCGSVYCCSFNQEGNLLATGSNDQIVHVIKYNPEKHKPDGSEYKLSWHRGTVRDISFMHGVNASYLVSAGAGENEINVTDCNTMKLTQTLRGHESAVMSLNCFNNSSTTLASGSLDGTIRLWDLRSRQSVLTLTTPQLAATTLDETTAATTTTQREATTSDANSTTNNKHAMQCDGVEGGEAKNHEFKGTPVGVVRVDPTDRLLVSGHKDGTCLLHDIRSTRLIQMIHAHEDEIRTLNFSPNSYYLLTASYDRRIKLIDLQGHLDKKLPSVELAELDDKVVQTAWHPSDYNFVTTCANGTANLWLMPDFNTWIESTPMN